MDNICKPIPSDGHLSKEPLNFGVSVFTPVSSVEGSSTFFFLQPLLTGSIIASVAILIAAQIFLFLADRLFGLESRPVQRGPLILPEQTVRMTLRDLQDFLASMPRNIQSSTDSPAPSTSSSSPVTGTSAPTVSTSIPTTSTSVPSNGANIPLSENVSTGTIETPETPLIFALAVWGDFTDTPYTPSVFLLFPVLTFPGLRGALPMLILELLAAIFVRAVVPPQTTGSRPLTNPTANRQSQSIFSPDDVLNLLNRFRKNK